jgi:hypothetical protein
LILLALTIVFELQICLSSVLPTVHKKQVFVSALLLMILNGVTKKKCNTPHILSSQKQMEGSDQLQEPAASVSFRTQCVGCRVSTERVVLWVKHFAVGGIRSQSRPLPVEPIFTASNRTVLKFHVLNNSKFISVPPTNTT